ncbi:TetR family transcriptional regulator OS=Ureibacillus acetophenoni OX=614649 GN=SAMN05877842_11271 PE=4 SV=1 [Ureibacillus acetophenoni]
MGSIHEEMAQKTRQEIQKCFIELLLDEGFQNITVKQIAERAGINRGTFYLHFVDKFDCMEQIQNQLLNELQEKMKNINPTEIFRSVQQQKIYASFLPIYEFILENANALRAILGNQGDPSFSEKVKEILKDTLIVRLSEYSPMLAQEEFKRYFSAFFTSAILGLFQEWLEDYKGKTIDDFAKIHFQILSFIGNLSLIVASKQPFDSK